MYQRLTLNFARLSRPYSFTNGEAFTNETEARAQAQVFKVS